MGRVGQPTDLFALREAQHGLHFCRSSHVRPVNKLGLT